MGVLDWLAGISAHDAPVDEEYDRRAKREFAIEDAKKDIADTLRREGIEKTYEPRVGVWKTERGERHPDLSNMDKWGHTPGRVRENAKGEFHQEPGKRDLRALKLALKRYPDFDPVELGAVREHWNTPQYGELRNRNWPAAPPNAPHALESAQSPVEMAIWWGPLLAKAGGAAFAKALRRPIKASDPRLPGGGKGSSKEPLKVYHGTPKTGFSSPTPQKSGLALGTKEVSLSTDPATAGQFAGTATGARIFPYHLAPRNPYFGRDWVRAMAGGKHDVVFKHGMFSKAPGEVHALVTDPRVLVSPYAPAAPPNLLPNLAPPVIGLGTR